MGTILFKQESYAIVGAAMQVHSSLGCGFVEKVYQEALEIEFTKRGIPFEREKRLLIEYNSQILKTEFYVDFLCYDKIVVELKAVTEIVGEHKSQVINYLKAGGFKLGYLINFGQQSLYYERLFHPNR
ncbi:MAG: GxxExxY protein [Muribaculaceae bacterium]|nr:GxxExxY protein [Muribaculaceae bacterium]